MTSTNDGKDVKSNQTSGPKGKSYYIELYKFLEARLSEGGDAHERTTHLCAAWRSVHSLCQHSAPSTHTHLINWLQRHTARAVLQTEWQTPKRKDDRKILEEAIDVFIGQVAESCKDGKSHSWESQLVARGEWFKQILDKPWGHPVLTLLLNPNGTPPTDDEVLAWLTEERGVTFVVRLHTLVGEKCDDIAVSLATAVMERARAALPAVVDSEEPTGAPVENAPPTFADKLKGEAGFTPDVWETITDIEFVLLHKRDSKRCITLAKQTPLLEAYPLIERLQKRLEVSPREKRLWKNAREVAILIAQVVIARCMVVKSCHGAARTALYCCARLLARLLTSRLPGAAGALAAQALTARHLHTLAQAVDKQLSPTNEEMKPYVCELYVRAITAGMNELERLKLKTEKDADARSMEKTLASWFVQLGTVLARSDRIACECTLTAFSLHPSQKMYERIEAAPPLAPVIADSTESKEETVQSEFGSWASDSRSQTNLVKTSETLKMKHTQNQANVLSTAIFNEGEALGLSPELCQDIAVLLSGPRVKTFSWDMDRTLLLDNCRAYCEVTQEGTRAMTRELKYLNIDPQQYQHLPEEKDDDENDPYYGIERGYEHLAVLDEPEEIWEDANDSEETESSSSIEKHYLAPRRKKKPKKVHLSSDEDSDPLSFVAESKRTQKKKERPHSKERSKKRKKKQELVDPLAIDGTSQNQSQTKPKKEPKEKKERKKKEKIPKVIGGKRSSLSSLIGIKVGHTKKKPKAFSTVGIPINDGVYESKDKHSLTSLNSGGKSSDAIYEKSLLSAERHKADAKEVLGPKPFAGTMKNQYRVTHQMFGNKCVPTHMPGRPPNNLSKMQYKPQNPNTIHQPSSSNFTSMVNNYKKYPDDVKANLSRLLDFRRQRDELKLAQQNKISQTPPRKPAIIRPDIPLQANISPKGVAIPEIPKSYINKEQAEKLAELIRMQKKASSSVIHYAKKPNLDKTKTDCNKVTSSSVSNRAQHYTSSMKMSDIINPSYDRLMAEIAERQSRGQEAIKPAHSQYQSNSQKLVQNTPRHLQKSLNTLTPGQRDFQNFLKEYEANKYNATTHAIDMSAKSSREVKKPAMPISRVVPVVPNVSKPESKPQQCLKQPIHQKKPEASLNTFSRLSYHKNKQNEIKNKNQPPKPACTTVTYQEVSSELDEIIKEHQLAQMKVLQSKRDIVERLPKHGQEAMNKCHPLLSNLLQSPTLSTNSPFCRDENLIKGSLPQYVPAPLKSSLSEKDNNDLLNLLRQQNKLNNYPQCYPTNVNSKPSPTSSTSTVGKSPPVTNYNPNSIQSQQQPSRPPNQNAKESVSSLESKIINVISNTLLKPGSHEINKCVNVKLHPNAPTTKPVNCTVTQATVKKNVTSKDQVEKNYIPESSKPEWQAVMCDLLKHKTPTRGPNALDVALDKSSFELAFEKSVKEASTFSQSVEKDATIKQYRKVDRPKPVITSIQNVIITKKGIKLQNEEMKGQKDYPADPKTYSKHVIAMNEKLKTRNASETTKKFHQEVQRKQFMYSGPKNNDPFISGIPNSDYDLLEELMDDDLRKEIGELSSDDESYNTAAQSFLKPSKNSEKRVSVQFNKRLNESASNLAPRQQYLKNRQSTNTALQSTSTVSQSTNKVVRTPNESNALKVHQKAPNITEDGNSVMAAASQCVLTHTSMTTKAQNQACNSVTFTNSQIMIEPNVYISAVPQPAPLQNVVLVGQELVYGGYTNVQAPVQSISNIAPNAYVAVNNTPTMTLYQTTQYTAPMVIGTSISVPVINNITCSAIPVQSGVINNQSQLSCIAVTKSSAVDPQVSIKTCDKQTKIISQDEANDSSQQHHKLQDENKAIERKVLSEVQEFVTTENIDNMRIQKIDNNMTAKIKKDIVADMDRVKKKRLAIVNREIYHRCGEDIIPLDYSPLPRIIKTDIEKHDISEAVSLAYASLSPKEDRQKLSDIEEEKLLVQIKNNLKDLSDAINEVSSPATPDSNDSKENKSYSAVPCRRILLRSSNKIIPKSNAEDTPILKKSKAKLKSETCEAVAAASDIVQVKTNEKEIGASKRASKRLRNKKITVITEEKKPLQQRQKPDPKTKPSSANKDKNKLLKINLTESLEFFDIETELQGSRISKVVLENKDKLENNHSNTENYVVDIAIVADKANENTIMKTSMHHKTEFPKISEKSAAFAEKHNEDIVPEVSVDQQISFSKQFYQKTLVPEDKEIKDKNPENYPELNTAVPVNKDLIPEMSIAHIFCLEQLSHKMPTLADKTNEDIDQKLSILEELSQKNDMFADKVNENIALKVSVPQKAGLLIQSCRDEIDNQPIKGIKINENDTPESIEEKNNANSTNENTSNVFTETKENIDDHSESKSKVKNVYSRISKPSCNEFEENVTTNDNKTKPSLDAKVSAEVYSAPDSSIKLMTTNGDVERLTEDYYSSINKTTTDQNKIDVLEKDNIDLDMIVTCEEVPKRKLSPVFENIKTARSKPITDKKDVKCCKNIIANKGIDTSNKNEKKEPAVVVLHNIEMAKTLKPQIQSINIDPTSESCLEIKTPKICPVSEVSNKQHSATDMDDDVVIIDDNTNTKQVVPLAVCGNGEVSVKKHVDKATKLKINMDPPVVNSVKKRVDDETSVKECKEHLASSNVLSHINDNKTQSETNAVENPELNDVEKFPDMPQHFKDNIRIEDLPSKDPTKTRLRISLPNGRKVIATVSNKVHVTYDTLFTHPLIRDAISNEMNCKKSYVMKIMQIVTVDKTDPNIILSAQLNDVETSQSNITASAPTAVSIKPVETIDLLSDDDDSAFTVSMNTNKQEFVTEYGHFNAPLMSKDLFKKHQEKFSQKSQILLKKVDEKPRTQVNNVEAKPCSPQNIALCDSTALIPNQYVTGLVNDIKNNLASKVNITPRVIPEVVEIDDSSNDSLYQEKSTVIIKEDKKINKLKDVLLKELGVEVPTQASAKKLQEIPSHVDDVDVVEKMQLPQNSNRRKVLKLSTLPKGESCPFVDLDEEEQVQITKRKCAVKLVRCDDLAKKCKRNSAATTRSSPRVLDDKPIAIREDFTIFNDLDEKIVEERSSSPVIELFDVLVPLKEKLLARCASAAHQAIPISCVANWHSTKSTLHSACVNNAAKVTVLENYTNISHNLIDKVIPLDCDVNWLTTKYTLHVQDFNKEGVVQYHNSQYDGNICDTSVIDKATPLYCTSIRSTKPMQNFNGITPVQSHAFENHINIRDSNTINKAGLPSCEANWLATNSILHIQDVNDETLAQSNISECDAMCNNSLSDKAIALSCEANWLTTKSMLHLQSVDEKTLAKSNDPKYEDEMSYESLRNQVIPLSCEANWLTSKPMLHLQSVNEMALIRSYVFEQAKICNDSPYKNIPLSCLTNWLTTTSSQYLQSVNGIILSNEIEQQSNRVLVHNVTPLSCETLWFATKTSLHLEAANSALLLRSNISTNGKDERRCSTSSLSKITKKMTLQTPHPASAPSLVSVVLKSFRNTNIIQKYSWLRKASPINLLKRKSLLPQNSAASKVNRLNQKPETKFSNCNHTTTVVIESSASNLGTISGHILHDTKMDCLFVNSSEYKIPKSLVQSTKCYDNDIMNVRAVAEADGFGNKLVEATNTNIGKVSKFSESSGILYEERDLKVRIPNEYESLSAVIDTTQLMAFENDTPIPFDKNNDHDSRPPSPIIPVEKILHSNECNSCYDITETRIVTENVAQQGINVIDNSTIHISTEAEKSEIDALKFQRSILSSTYKIEAYPNENMNTSNSDEIEIKLTGTSDEPTINEKTTNSQSNNEVKMSDNKKSDKISITLEVEPFMKTDIKKTNISVSHDEQNDLSQDVEIPVNKYAKVEDHEYFASFDAVSVLESIDDETSNDNYEEMYVLTDDVIFLSENESTTGLEEEVVDMCSDEIVDDFLYVTTTNVNFGESNSKKQSDQLSGSVSPEEDSATKVFFNKVTIRKDDITIHKEKDMECLETTKDFIAATKNGDKMDENPCELSNDVSAESIMNKYLALIRNKSEVLESVVEYEDPDAGTCYVIPIIQESSNTSIESIENAEVTSIIENTKNKEAKPANTGNSHQHNTSPLSTVLNEHDHLSYDDINPNLTELIGESLPEKKINNLLPHTHQLDGKYKTVHTLGVIAIPNSQKSIEDVACKLKQTNKDKKTTSHKALETKSVSSASKKRLSKYLDKPEHDKIIMNARNMKVILPELTSTISSQQTKRQSLKRKIDMSNTKTCERKYQKGQAKLAEVIGGSFIQNEITQNIRFDEKYKTSYTVEVESISNTEKNAEDIISQFIEINQDCQKTLLESLGAERISCVSKRRRSKHNDKSEDVNCIADTETLKVTLPKHTYSKADEQIKTRRRSFKRTIDVSDTKTSEKKYRKGKNIDYPRFTAASLSETVYAKEYKTLIDYCSSIKFSFAVPFHKEEINVHDNLKSWPIKNTYCETNQIEHSVDANATLFTEIEKSEALLDPLAQTLPEEIISNFDENSYTPSNIHETNFNMGFGERSGRVIQKSKDGETTFSAATLSDVKQLQPLLPSDENEMLVEVYCLDNNGHDQKVKTKRFVDHLHLREKVRSFFEKTRVELSLDYKRNYKKDDSDSSDWPFGDLTSTRCFEPSPIQVTVNVVQVGQLPVSAAAQNPVTCDPRVTHVSNASPSQCSPENSLGDELQTPIKTEYTELTTADITLPLMQEYVQHHSLPSKSQEHTNIYNANDSTTQIKSIVKIELMEEITPENEEENVDYENNELQELPNGNRTNSVQYQFENITNNVASESDSIAAANSSNTPKTTLKFTEDNLNNITVEKPDQLAHAMNAAGISAIKGLTKMNDSVDTMQESTQLNVTQSSTNTTNFSKTTPINAIALQQALAQILPPPLNQAINTNENNPQTSANPQVLHIVQGNNAQSVINKPNGTQLLHIVQNKGNAGTNASQLPASQQNTFSGLSLVDGAIQQSGNQLLHIVNTANQKSTNAGQLLKRVNLLTNLTNVQGSNDQKMVQFVCKSADGKSIQLPHQRSMVLRLQPLDQPNVPTAPTQNDNQDHSSTSGTTNSVNDKESSPQEMKSRSLYEENYAKFVQNDAKFVQNGDSRPGSEKATSLPKFNQVFGKQVYQDKQNEMNNENLTENPEVPEENNAPLDQINDITNPPMLVRKTNPTQPSHVQPNLVQQIKQTIGPMNIQTMHGGVIYTRQIPVNIGNGQTINLITVPSTELVDDSAQKQQTDSKFGNQDGDPPIIKIVPTNQPAGTPNGSPDDNNASIRSTNNTNTQSNPQPVLTQMRIKLPMLSKAPHMVGGTRVVRPSFFQIQRNVIGGANQQVYQQLVLTAAPPLGQSIRLPTQVQKPKTPSETQSSPESQMSSSTLEQLREFDMVLEQVKERSTVQPGSSTSSSSSFTKLKSSPDTTDAPTPSKPTQESPTQVLYSVGNTQPLNMSNYVSRKSTITSTTSSSFVRSPDSTGTVESPSSSTHSHLPHTVTSDSCASSSCASEAAAATAVQPKPKKKKPKPSTSNSNPFNIKNTPKPSSQKPLEDEQTTQRILYILAEYKEQVENSPDKDKPAPRRRNNPAAPNAGSSKRKKSSSGSRRRDMSPVLGEDSCRTMGSEDSSCGTSLGECNECLETHSPEESPKKVVRRLTFEQETIVTQTRTITTSTTTTTTVPQRNVIVTDGQAFAVRGATGKPATTVLMPANYLLPVSMVKGGQQIAIVTNRGPKLLVGAGDAGSGGALLFQRLIGPGGLKPVLARPGVRHIRLPTAALHNLQAFNIATPTVASVQPPDSTASPAPAPTPPDLVDTRAMSSPWPDRDVGEVKPDKGNSSPEGSEPWNLPSSSIADDYGYEEIVRTDNMDRTVLVVHRKDGRHTTRLSHVSAAALRHKYAILEHELRLQKSLSEECEDLGVDSPSASELFPEAELLFAPSPAHEQTIDHCHTPQPTIHTQGISQPDLDDQIATDQLLTHKERHDDLDINLDDVGEIVTVGEDGMTTIPLDHEEFARSHEEFARSHPNTTFHSEPEDGEVPPFTIAQGVKGRQITFHSRGVPVVMASQTTVISQATVEATGTQNPVKFSDIDNMINAMPSPHHSHISMPSVLKESNETLTKFDRLLNESREFNLSNTTSAIVHSTGNGTQVIRRVQYERRDSRYLVEEDAMIAGDSKIDERRDMMDDTSSPERHPELFWDTQSRPERRRFDFSSDSDKCCKSPYDEMNSDSSGIGAHMRLDSVIKAARPERRRSDGSSSEESHPPLRTYPPKRTHQHTHHSHHHDVDRSVTGKTRATDRCHDVKDESRRRASNRGVVKRGCHCCNGSSPPKPKKSRPKKSNDYPHN